jgi:hypothetical protein
VVLVSSFLIEVVFIHSSCQQRPITLRFNVRKPTHSYSGAGGGPSDLSQSSDRLTFNIGLSLNARHCTARQSFQESTERAKR